MYFYCSYFYIFCPYEFLELIEILFCSILNRIGPDMSRYYRNSVFRQTSRGLVSTLDFVKTRKYFYCSYFYILCPYEFIEFNEFLIRSILNRIGPDMSRYYRNSVFRQTSKGLVSTQDFVKSLQEVFRQTQLVHRIFEPNVFLLFIFLHILSL